MKTQRLSLFAAVTLAVILTVTSSRAMAAGAGDFIQTAAERTFSSLSQKELSEEDRDRRFRELLLETFDLPAIARFTLGRYWRRASKPQQKEYVRLFEEFVVMAYSHRFRDLTGKEFKVTNVRVINETESAVASQLVIPNRAPVRVNWRVKKNSSNYKVVDVTVEGISMSVTQRDEFAAVIRSSGGRVDGLIRALRKKIGK